MKQTIGGNRLGSGKKMMVDLHNYGRSTHDLGYIWRSTMACGTLVPFMSQLALPGDSFDIELNADVKTYPTAGPLFGSYKLQLDIFQCPLRLYQAALHNNAVEIGRNMAQVKLPLLKLRSNALNFNSDTPLEFQQINQSALLAYLGIRGVGKQYETIHSEVEGFKLGIPYVSYWDIYKNYYANKQEGIGMLIHTEDYTPATINRWTVWLNSTMVEIGYSEGTNIFTVAFPTEANKIRVSVPDDIDFDAENGTFITLDTYGTVNAKDYMDFVGEVGGVRYSKTYEWIWHDDIIRDMTGITLSTDPITVANQISLEEFPLENIDTIRESILSHPKNAPFIIDKNSISPFGKPLKQIDGNYMCSIFSQEGLGLKTYQSDIFNNWMDTEWIDGSTGVNAISRVDTSEGYFNIDTLNLAQKVYAMLNRIAISGGTYYDWLKVNWTVDGFEQCETPMYMGGLSKEIVFQEVVNNAQSEGNPLGDLGGRGTMAKKHKGGSVRIKVKNEPSFIIGIVSITPRVDYSQGNDWTTRLRTMDDLHKPALDEIGFQDLITDQMAFWDTKVSSGIDPDILKSAGKQPAYINYMTEFNKCFGNFADPRSEMFMTLNRRYEHDKNGNIKDLTTYIDPKKFNYAFAQTDLTAQNFWVQIAIDNTVRRVMSAKVMPNL